MNSWGFECDNANEWAYWSQLFTENECDEIIKICKNKKLSEALITNDGSLDADYRKSNIVFVGANDLEWVYRRLTDACVNLNERFFGFDLWGFVEGLQFTEYKTPGGKYSAHLDKIYGGRVRKLSIVVQLTKPEKYKCCDLELITSDREPIKMSRARGDLLVFPSYILHRVTPIEKGTRHSLVGWITGKPFK
jgi:PKHD-type hydroxylase